MAYRIGGHQFETHEIPHVNIGLLSVSIGIMDEDTIQDLKQFIAATVSQQVGDIRSDIAGIHSDIGDIRSDIAGIHSDIQALDDKLSSKIDDLSKSVAEAIEANNEATDVRLGDYERRIVRLERTVANNI